MTIDDTDLHSNPCPKCKNNNVLNRECNAIGCEDGYYNPHEDDPLWFHPGEMVKCEDCNGHGRHIWCRDCGWDLLQNFYLWDCLRCFRGTIGNDTR
jgi:hypothetical protein